MYVLERSLRLWHPFMPYISETLWQAMPHQGTALVVAAWPEGGARCEAALAQFGVFQEVVGAVRNARADYSVEISKKVEAAVVVEDAELRAALSGESAALCQAAKIAPDSFRSA